MQTTFKSPEPFNGPDDNEGNNVKLVGNDKYLNKIKISYLTFTFIFLLINILVAIIASAIALIFIITVIIIIIIKRYRKLRDIYNIYIYIQYITIYITNN